MKTLKEKKKECQRLRKSAKTKRLIQKASSGPVCRLCLREPGDPEKLGEFLQKDNLSVHYFCLILSSKLPQRGQSNRGFHGFLPEDIKKEAIRASKKVRGPDVGTSAWGLLCVQEEGSSHPLPEGAVCQKLPPALWPRKGVPFAVFWRIQIILWKTSSNTERPSGGPGGGELCVVL